MITPTQIANATGSTLMRAANWAQPLQEAMDYYEIDTPERQAAFLAQIGHESDHLEFTVEIWGPTVAQRGYEGRVDLGNLDPGDGYRYRGRGLIQITGHANYIAARRGMSDIAGLPDFELQPDALAAPRWAAMSAAWYWKHHGLNDLADAGEFETITRRINGGENGEPQRLALWSCAKDAMGCNT